MWSNLKFTDFPYRLINSTPVLALKLHLDNVLPYSFFYYK